MVYATRRQEDRDEPDVIASTFSVHTVPFFALLDNGSTHSYVSSSVTGYLKISEEDTGSSVSVYSPVCNLMVVTNVYKDCPLQVQGKIFPANLMELLFGEFDLILGMD